MLIPIQNKCYSKGLLRETGVIPVFRNYFVKITELPRGIAPTELPRVILL